MVILVCYMLILLYNNMHTVVFIFLAGMRGGFQLEHSELFFTWNIECQVHSSPNETVVFVDLVVLGQYRPGPRCRFR